MGVGKFPAGKGIRYILPRGTLSDLIFVPLLIGPLKINVLQNLLGVEIRRLLSNTSHDYQESTLSTPLT